MSTIIESIEQRQLKRVPRFAAGDRVRVHFQVVEGTRRRTQVFEGVVIARSGSGARETFTVRKQSFGVGVERTFPLHSPKIEKIEVAARGDVRRAKLYYLRERVGRGARVRERRWTGAEEEAFVEGAMPPDDVARPGEEELAAEAQAEEAAAQDGGAGAAEGEAAPAGEAAESGSAEGSGDGAGTADAGDGGAPEAAGEPAAEAAAEQSETGGDVMPDDEAEGDEPAQEPAEASGGEAAAESADETKP